MPRQKIAFIGAGSFAFTVGLVRDFINQEDMSDSDLVMMDVDPEGLELATGLSRALIKLFGTDLTVRGTMDRREALDGADFVIATVAPGGYDAWAIDAAVPGKYGVKQGVGDTVGPGGVIRGLRHVPLMLDIAKDMRELCPEGWLLNYTNPMASICLALERYGGVKYMGLCHGIHEGARVLARHLGLPYEEMTFKAAGVNHLGWYTAIHLRGQDAYPMVRAALEPGGKLYEQMPVTAKLTQMFGLIPTTGDRHVSEFFPWFYGVGADPSQYGLFVADLGDHKVETDIGLGPAVRKQFRRQLQNIANGSAPLPGPPQHKHGEAGYSSVDRLAQSLHEGSWEAAVQIMSSIRYGKDETFLANVINRGHVGNVPAGIIELPVVVGADGIHPLYIGDLPTAISAVTAQHMYVQDLTVEAAVRGDRNMALQAMLLDPLASTAGIERAEAMLKELMELQKDHLPQFRG